MIVFSWQLLQDRTPKRYNLFKHHVILDPDGISCVLCSGPLKSLFHLFVTREMMETLWYMIFKSLRVVFLSFLVIFHHFLRFFMGWGVKSRIIGGLTLFDIQ